MDDTHDGAYAREPQIADLVRVCRALNETGARYLLIGGFAVIAHGGARTTKDIDFLIDASTDNVARVKRALRVLEDHAADDVEDRRGPVHGGQGGRRDCRGSDGAGLWNRL